MGADSSNKDLSNGAPRLPNTISYDMSSKTTQITFFNTNTVSGELFYRNSNLLTNHTHTFMQAFLHEIHEPESRAATGRRTGAALGP